MMLVRHHPWQLLCSMGTLRSGAGVFTEDLWHRAALDAAHLPYDPSVVAFLTEEHAQGRRIILATSGSPQWAEEIAAHLGFFDEILIASAKTGNPIQQRLSQLLEQYGSGGFDYLGHSAKELPLWAVSGQAYLVKPSPSLQQQLPVQARVLPRMHSLQLPWRNWIRALRLHQWLKNLLLFVPLLTAHQLGDGQLLWQGWQAFIWFGLCASSVYVLNDLLDLAEDRQHPSKKHRPFAARHLSVIAGLLAVPLLLMVAFGGAVSGGLPRAFVEVLGFYYVLTLAYSLYLKRQMALDVITLALLYTLRIVAGAAAVGLPLTFWVLAFSMFMFLSLALVKRYAELREARQAGQSAQTPGRGYYPGDLEMIAALGAASGYLSVMVLALYLHDEDTTALYRQPELIWLACPLLLFWITRMWMLTHRGLVHQDPVLFALRDRVSLMVGGLFGLVFWMAT